jgi:hypothetical protein
VHSYDNFIASEPYLLDFIRTQFGEPIELGQSFAAIFRQATASFADLIEVHAGDLLSQTWPLVWCPINNITNIYRSARVWGEVVSEHACHSVGLDADAMAWGFVRLIMREAVAE